MTVKDLPAAMRPREKLLALGPAALADAELLALLLRTGLPGQGVLQLAEQLLLSFGGVHGLLRATAEDLRRIKGMGPAKRAELVAVLELARRSLTRQLQQAPVFSAPERVRDYLMLQLAHLTHEVFSVMFLDVNARLIEYREMFRGTLTQTSVHPREIVRQAMTLNAAAVLLAHNHPSGAAEPSRADEFLTQRLKSALALIEVEVLDHVVVGHDRVVSFRDRGLL